MRRKLALLVLALVTLALPAWTAAASATCTSSLRTELDRPSFENRATPNRRPTAAQLETLRTQAEQRFRAVAARMCATRLLRADALRPFRRLLIQQADGADNTAFMTGDEAIGGRGTLVFQYVFDEGGEAIRYSVPDEQDVREGLICWADWDGNSEMCEQRLP